MWDLFISHASEDKPEIVRPLAEALTAFGLRVWYDEFELKPGSKLIDSIERGLQESKHGLVIISRSFLEKEWPKRELTSLFTRELAYGESERILPVWVGVDYGMIARYNLTLADRYAIKFQPDHMEVQDLAWQVVESINPEIPNSYTRISAYRELKRNHKDSFHKESIKLDRIEPSSPRHKTLPKNIILVAQFLCAVFDDVFPETLDETILNFACDLDYEMEALIWTSIASSYLEFFKSHPELFSDELFKADVLFFLLDQTLGLDERSTLLSSKQKEELRETLSNIHATLLVKFNLQDQMIFFDENGSPITDNDSQFD